MSDTPPPLDYYELLQLSPNADQETISRVYRLLAQRMHPDNRETGDEAQFRAITEAHKVLSDPERRAKYDVAYHAGKQDRWRLFSAPESRPANDFEAEQLTRLTVLEVLYARRRIEPKEPGLYNMELGELLGRPLEHIEFTIWYLLQRKLILRTDNSKLAISVEGIDYVEQQSEGHQQRRRLYGSTLPPSVMESQS